MRPHLESSVHDRHGPVGAGPEKGQKDGQREAALLLWGKAELLVLQPGQRRLQGKSPYLKGTSKKGGVA